MSNSWPPAPTVEDCDDDELPPVIKEVGAMPSLQDAVTPQQTTSSVKSTAALNGSMPNPTATAMPGSWSSAPTVEDHEGDDMPALEEVIAPEQPSSHTAAAMPGSWPPAPTVEDCDGISPVADDYDDMSGLEEAAASQQPMSSDTSATAPGGPTPTNAQNNANAQPPPYSMPFSFPFTAGNLGAGVGANANPAGQAMPAQIFASMLAQAFGSLAGVPVGTGPSQPTVPSATNPLASMADLVSALNGQHQTEGGQDDEEDEFEDDDGDMPALEPAAASVTPVSASQDGEDDDWEDVDDDMPSLEAAPPLATFGQPAPHPDFPPNPFLHQTPFTAAIASFAQSLTSTVQNSQTAPPGATSQQSAGSHGGTASNAATSTDPATGPSGVPLPFPFPGAVQVSMGTISTGGPNGVQVTATTIPMPGNFNDFAAGFQQAMASMSESNLDDALAANFTFQGPLPPLSEIFNMAHPAFAPGPPFNASEFVDSLERVDIANIAEEDMRCAHCWLPFGTTDEDVPDFVFAPDKDEAPLNAERQVAFHEMPFCAARPDNDPVRTPCGHIFGRGCLIETLERVNTRCPTCRREFRQPPDS